MIIPIIGAGMILLGVVYVLMWYLNELGNRGKSNIFTSITFLAIWYLLYSVYPIWYAVKGIQWLNNLSKRRKK